MLTKDDLQQIGHIVQKEIKKELDPVKKDLKDVKKNVNKIDKTVDVMLDLLDEEQMKQRKRIKRIENHLELPLL